MAEAWWQDCVVYQIYPRSFQDSNNDGIGDIPGIISRLDYLRSLRIDAIWLSPIFLSPMADFGYDVSDYCQIDPVFGTIDDVDQLLEQAHARDIKVLFDMVLNHTSDLHPWFVESRSSRDNDKADYYIWSDTIPNNWMAAFGGKAWTFDKKRGQYYLHSFLPKQPDLNWRNPNVVEDVFKQLDFWLKRGVDGFRLDVINCIIKDDALRNNPKIFGARPRSYDMQRHIFDRNRPEVHKRLRKMRTFVDTYPGKMMVGEIMVELPGEPELAASFLGPHNDELNLTFDFSLAYTKFSALRWKRVAKRWYEAVGRHRVPTWVLNNHDLNRILTRLHGNEAKARLAALFLLTQRGAIFLYYGEELGLPNSKISRSLIHDPVGNRYWPFYKGRDGERGPMVWTTGEGNGFTNGKSWLPFTNSANRYCVENEELETGSMLQFYRTLLVLRKEDEVLRRGFCTFLDPSSPHVLAYLRELDEQKHLVLLNMRGRTQQFTLSAMGKAQLLFSTHIAAADEIDTGSRLTLEPFQGCIYSLKTEE